MRDLLYLKDDQIKELIELIFFVYRETYSDHNNVLKKYSFGKAHQRVLQLVERHENISVSELLKKLKITKQSLNRVLNDLFKKKMVLQKKGQIDARQKLLKLDKEGKKLFDEIFIFQKNKIFQALKNSDADSVIKFKKVLEKMANG